MNCQETRRLLHGYLDGELDLAGSLAIEDHLHTCPACAARHKRHRALREAVTAGAGFYPAPLALTRRIARNLNDVAHASDDSRWRWPWLAVALPVMLGALATLAWVAWPQTAQRVALAQTAEKVVYHINNSDEATNALRNVTNHLEISPKARIVVVAHNNGVDFLLEGATDQSGRPYQATVTQLVGRGVDFRVCQITLVRREVNLGKVIPQASLVPSGIAEITRLQVKEGFAYLKP
jgi:uncharacterized protein